MFCILSKQVHYCVNGHLVSVDRYLGFVLVQVVLLFGLVFENGEQTDFFYDLHFGVVRQEVLGVTLKENKHDDFDFDGVCGKQLIQKLGVFFEKTLNFPHQKQV